MADVERTTQPAAPEPAYKEPVYDEKKASSVDKETESVESPAHDLEPEELILVNDGNPFPIDPNAPEEDQQLTVRAVVIGSILGLVVGASNVYLGLKTGFTFGASLFGAIFGFAIIKPLSHALPTWFGGGYFGPKENCTVQTAATAAGGLTGLFVAAVPAMYHLGLMTNPVDDIGRLFLLTIITAFYGVFFAIPLRKFYILKQKLVFPTPAATGFTIRSLHSTTNRAARVAAKKKVAILSYSFIGTFVYKQLAAGAPGLLVDWHIFWWLFTWGWKDILSGESWGWVFEITPAFFAAGMLSGLNASWSFMIGAILAWGIIGPGIVASGLAFGSAIDPELYPGWYNYMGMSLKDPVNRPSPRYWLLWPGIFIMLVYSFAEIAASGPTFYQGFKVAAHGFAYDYRKWQAKRAGREFNEELPVDERPLDDPAGPEEQVPVWAWAGGVLISSVVTLVVGKLSFGMDVGVGILALLLAFLFSFCGVQSSGTTDVNPVGTIAKASQLIIGGVTKGNGTPVQDAQLTNLIAGSIAGQAASHAVDMCGDLKTGHLLRASPVGQFWAQVAGSVIGIWLSVGLFVLFAKAYPCLTDLEVECTQFGMPAVAAWRSIAVAVTAPQLPIPPSAGYTAIGLGILSAITVFVKYRFVPEKYRHWVINWNAVGLGFVVPQIYYPLAMVIGAHIAYTWEKRWPKKWEVWGFALSAGLVAGEGMSGVMTALLVIVGASGEKWGSSVACPAYEYCG